MDNFISVTQLQLMDDLFKDQMDELDDHVAALTLEQAKDPRKFDQHVQATKKAVLLRPVSIKDPKVIDHDEEIRTVGPSAENMWGEEKTFHHITVGYDVSGSDEVFGAYPNGGSLDGLRFYQPEGGSIEILVTLGTLNKEGALAKANELMAPTYGLISQANPQVEKWSKTTEPIIQRRLEKRRDELLALYS